jgi:uncharacterized protein YllA (UPF0747 family)
MAANNASFVHQQFPFLEKYTLEHLEDQIHMFICISCELQLGCGPFGIQQEL